MRKPFKTFTDMAAYLELIRPLQGDDGQGRGKCTPGRGSRTVDVLNKPQRVDQGNGGDGQQGHRGQK
jgi:hypothetical protein